MKIGIVTDSTSDISPQEAEENDIRVIPSILIIDGNEYLDGAGISREEYYEQLPDLTPPPTTAAPSSGMFEETYQELFAHGYDKIVSIHVASTLSGIVNAAQVAAKTFDGRIQVVDSGQLSLGFGFQVMAAAQAAGSGSVDQVLAATESIRRRVQVIAMLNTLEQLKRSGRVNWLRSSLGSLLRIKLFLEVKDSQILRIGETRTRKKGVQRLCEMIESNGALEKLAIVHTNAFEEAQTLAEKYAPIVSSPPLTRNVTTVVGTHVGTRAIGFISVRAE